VGRSRSGGSGRVDLRADGWAAGQKPLLIEQCRQGDTAEPRAAPLEEGAAIEQVAAGVGKRVMHGGGQYSVMNSLAL
jgi:hypothetical protein